MAKDSVTMTQAESRDGVTLYTSEAYTFIRREGTLSGVRFYLQTSVIEEVSPEWAAGCGHRYHVEIGAVCESELGTDTLARLLAGIGLDGTQWGGYLTPADRACELVRAGFKAIFWQQTGNNIARLTREARGKLTGIGGKYNLFSSLMGTKQNRAGDDGFATIAGRSKVHGKTMKEVVSEAVENETEEG